MSKSRNSQIKQRWDYDPDSHKPVKPKLMENRRDKRIQDRALKTRDVSVFYEEAADDWDEWDDSYDYSRR